MSASLSNPFPVTAQHAASRPLTVELFLVLAYVVLLPYQITAGEYLRIAPCDLFVILSAVVVPFRLVFRTKAWSIWHVGILLTFTMGSLVTAARSGDLTRYILVNKDVGIVLFVATYLLITTVVNDWQKLRMVLRAFVAGVVAQNLVGLFAFLSPYFGAPIPALSYLTNYGGARLSGMLIDPNAYGGLLVLAFVLLETAAEGIHPLFRPGWTIFSRITLLMGILFSFSRTAWVSLFIALLFILPRRLGKTALRVLTGVPFVAVGMWFAGDRLTGLIGKMVWRPEAGTGRGELVAAAFEHFAQHPIIGGGLGSFIDEQGIIVHNSALWFLADFGLIGIVIFTGFMAWFFLKALQAYRFCPRIERAVVYSLAVGHVAMCGLAMGIEAFYQRHWWLVMGLIGAVCHLTARRQWLARTFRRAL